MKSTYNTEKIRATSIIGRKILSKSDGSVIGEVHDIVYNPKNHKVEYLVTQKSGWFKNAKVIPLSSIDVIGEDRVMVPNSYVELEEGLVNKKLRSLIQEDDIINKLNVVTRDGKLLGKIVDIYFDRVTGIIDQFEVSDGFIDKIISGTMTLRVNKIKLVGQDAVIVEISTAEKFEEEQENQGLIGIKNDISNQAEAAYKSAKEKTVELAENVKIKSKELDDKISSVSQSVVEITKNNADEVITDIKEKVQPEIKKIKNKVDENTPNSEVDLKNQVQEKFNSIKGKVANTADLISSKGSSIKSEAQRKIKNEAISRAIGKVVNKAVVSNDNSQIIITKGTVIDMDIINLAAEYGKEGFVLNPINYN